MSDPAVGRASYGLTEKGKQQAREACDRLVRALSTSSSSGGPGSSDDCDCSSDLDLLAERVVVVSSDFKRTRETAEIIHSGLGVKAPLRFSPALWERNYGSLNLKRVSTYGRLAALDMQDPNHTQLENESLMSVVKRTSDLMKKLDEEMEGKVILMVSHQEIAMLMQVINHGLPLENLYSIPEIGNCEFIELSN